MAVPLLESQETIPQFCRLDPLKYDGEHLPVRLEQFDIEVETRFGKLRMTGHWGGHGITLIVLAGYTSTSSLYKRSMGFLARRFRVVIINGVGHGGAGHLPLSHNTVANMGEVVVCFARQMGIRRALVAGHSLGGQIAAYVAADYPELVIELIAVNSITGEFWDERVAPIRPLVQDLLEGHVVKRMRAVALLLPRVGPLIGNLVADSFGMVVDSHRADAPTIAKIGTSLYFGHVLKPHRLLPAGLAIISAPPTVPVLRRIAQAGVPVAVLHGLSDPVVSLQDAVSTRDLTNGRLLVVEPTQEVASGHSWLLEHCMTLDWIMKESLLGPLGVLLRKELIAHGLNPRIATQATIEGSSDFYAPNSRILREMPVLRLHHARHPGSRSAMQVPWRHHEPMGSSKSVDLADGLARRAPAAVA